MTSEVLLIFFVAILVFGPNKLPMLAEHFAKFLNGTKNLKKQIDDFWQHTLAKQTLYNNQHKAVKADEIYQNREIKQSVTKIDRLK